MLKRKMIKLLLAIIFFLGGIFLFIYPRVTDKLYKDKVDILEETYIKQIEEINKTDDANNKFTELYNLLKQENEKIYKDGERIFLTDKTFDITDIDLSIYGLNDQIFGFIEIPSINIKLPIYLGSSDYNMTLGATHLTGTSYPIGGVNTNSLIAAHRGFYKTEMFRNIDKINIGDKLYIKNFRETLEYTAVSTLIIKPDELNKLTIKEGHDMVTIISCHPFPSNTHRYVVFFERSN